MLYVLTVCFNNIEGLKKTFSSLKSQTTQNYDWIVVDGNSTDGTLDWLENLESTDVKFLSEPDKGIYDAMNKGISLLKKNQKGHFIFMNSGDEFHDECVLEKVQSVNSSYCIIYGDYNDTSTDGSSVIKKAKSPSHLKNGMLTSHQAIFFSVCEYKNLFHNLKYSLSGDYDYIIRAFEIAKLKELPTYKLDLTICNFYLDGISVLNRKKALLEDFKIRREALNMGLLLSSFLYIVHLFHFYLKKTLPSFFTKRRV